MAFASNAPRGELTAREIECLLLVGEQLTSKEIAQQLRISRHTVDARVRSAMKLLGAEHRWAAAAIVMRALPRAEQTFGWPMATLYRPDNTLSVAQRLFWIAAIGLAGALSFIMYWAGLEALARMAG